MTELLIPTYSDEASFVATTINSGSLSIPGSSPFSVLISAPSGQRVRLTGLSTNTGRIFGGEISIGGVSIGRAAFGDASNGNNLSIGSHKDFTGSIPPFRNYEFITGGVDEDVIISSDAPIPPTASIIYYAYEFGDFKDE